MFEGFWNKCSVSCQASNRAYLLTDAERVRLQSYTDLPGSKTPLNLMRLTSKQVCDSAVWCLCALYCCRSEREGRIAADMVLRPHWLFLTGLSNFHIFMMKSEVWGISPFTRDSPHQQIQMFLGQNNKLLLIWQIKLQNHLHILFSPCNLLVSLFWGWVENGTCLQWTITGQERPL